MKRQAGNLIFLILGLFGIWQACRLPHGSFSQPGPGFLPLYLSLVIFFLAFALIATEWRERTVKPKVGMHKSGLKVVLTLGALVGYVFLLKPVGFLIITFFLLFFMFYIVQKIRWPLSLLLSLVTPVLARIVFGTFLGVPFPDGILGF